MEPSISCAVCGFQNIDAQQGKCPQCDADLTCFKVLEKIPDGPVPSETVPKRVSILEIYLAIAVTMCVVLLAFFVFSFRQTQSQVEQLQTALNSYRTNHAKTVGDTLPKKPSSLSKIKTSQKVANANRQKKPRSLSNQSRSEVKRKKQPMFRLYRVGKETALWSISKKVYGEGYYFPVILEHNPGLGIFNVRTNQKLRIMNDTSQVKKIYQSIIQWEDGEIIWWYTIQTKDNPPTIAQKFYNEKEMVEQLFYDNPNSQFRSGEKIKITLE